MRVAAPQVTLLRDGYIKAGALRESQDILNVSDADIAHNFGAFMVGFADTLTYPFRHPINTAKGAVQGTIALGEFAISDVKDDLSVVTGDDDDARRVLAKRRARQARIVAAIENSSPEELSRGAGSVTAAILGPKVGTAAVSEADQAASLALARRLGIRITREAPEKLFRFANRADPRSLMSNLSQRGWWTRARVKLMLRFRTYRIWRADRHMHNIDRESSPFVSLIEDPVQAKLTLDPQLRTIATGYPGHPMVRRAPDLFEFTGIPAERLEWPLPFNDMSIFETEVLFLGDDLVNWMTNVFDNPY